MNVKLYILLLLSSFPIGDSLAIDKEKRDEIFKNYQSRPPIEGVHIYGSSEQLKFIAYVTDGNIIIYSQNQKVQIRKSKSTKKGRFNHSKLAFNLPLIINYWVLLDRL